MASNSRSQSSVSQQKFVFSELPSQGEDETKIISVKQTDWEKYKQIFYSGGTECNIQMWTINLSE